MQAKGLGLFLFFCRFARYKGDIVSLFFHPFLEDMQAFLHRGHKLRRAFGRYHYPKNLLQENRTSLSKRLGKATPITHTHLLMCFAEASALGDLQRFLFTRVFFLEHVPPASMKSRARRNASGAGQSKRKTLGKPR